MLSVSCNLGWAGCVLATWHDLLSYVSYFFFIFIFFFIFVGMVGCVLLASEDFAPARPGSRRWPRLGAVHLDVHEISNAVRLRREKRWQIYALPASTGGLDRHTGHLLHVAGHLWIVTAGKQERGTAEVFVPRSRGGRLYPPRCPSRPRS